MNRGWCVVLAVGILVGCATGDLRHGEDNQGDLRVVSLNVHYYEPDRDHTDWAHRKLAVTAALKELAPDLILFQEMQTFEGRDDTNRNDQRDWVLQTVPGCTAGASAADASTFPITQPIFFRTDRFRLVDQGWFFFSPTPDVAYARTWTNSWPSFTTWVLLEEARTGRRLYVYNTHPEAFSDTNQRRGMPLVRDRIEGRAHPEVPVLLGGDFNQFGDDPKMRVFTEAGLVRAPVDTPSFHFFLGLHLYPAIDHLFTSPTLHWLGGGAVQRQWEGYWPSDHHPVVGDFHWD